MEVLRPGMSVAIETDRRRTAHPLASTSRARGRKGIDMGAGVSPASPSAVTRQRVTSCSAHVAVARSPGLRRVAPPILAPRVVAC
jgi:hypothetical protein